jgi:hypothetical protein
MIAVILMKVVFTLQLFALIMMLAVTIIAILLPDVIQIPFLVMILINVLLMDVILILVVLIPLWTVMILILAPWIIVILIMVVGMMLMSALKETRARLFPVANLKVVFMRMYLVKIIMSVPKILVISMDPEIALVNIKKLIARIMMLVLLILAILPMAV